MLWFLERGSDRLQCEIRPAMDGRGFELVWTQAAPEHIERFEDGDSAEQRWRQLEESLKQDGWTRIGRITPPKRFL